MIARSVRQLFLHVLSILLLLKVPFWQASWKRRTIRVGLHGVYAYAGILLVLLCLEDWFLYHPMDAADWSPPPSGLAVEDVELTGRDGTRIHAWWSAPEGWEPAQGAVLFFHGNGGSLSHRGRVLRTWNERMGLAVLMIDYPGFGRSGGKPSEAGCYAAGDAAYDHLVQVRKVPPQRVVLYGGSLGGGIATDLACRRPHWALVLVSAFTSFPDMAQKQYPWLPGRWLVHNQFNNLHKIPSCRGPVFIAHGRTDGLIPFAQGERLYAAAGEPKRFFPMDDYRHNDSPTDAAYPVLRRFLDEHAPPLPAN